MLEALAIYFPLLMIFLLAAYQRYEKNSLNALVEIEKRIDPGFAKHKNLWDYYNNNYTVLIRREGE